MYVCGHMCQIIQAEARSQLYFLYFMGSNGSVFLICVTISSYLCQETHFCYWFLSSLLNVPIYFVYMFVGGCATSSVWWSEDNIQELISPSTL